MGLFSKRPVDPITALATGDFEALEAGMSEEDIKKLAMSLKSNKPVRFTKTN